MILVLKIAFRAVLNWLQFLAIKGGSCLRPTLGYSLIGLASERRPWTTPKIYRLGTHSPGSQY